MIGFGQAPPVYATTCIADGCTSPVYRWALCRTHHRRWTTTGTIDQKGA